MKISNNILSVLVVTYIIFSLSSTMLDFKENQIVTGKASSAQGIASFNLLPRAVASPTNLYAFLGSDHISINLNWTDVTDAPSYTVYYSDNVTELKNMDTNSLSAGIFNVSGLTDSNWVDTNAEGIEKRFYRVAAVSESNKNLTDKIVGKYDIEIMSSTGVAGVMEGNVISLPLISENNSIDYIVRYPSFDDRAIIYNISSDVWMLARYWGPAWGWWGAEFTDLNVNRGYWFTIVANNHNLTNVGDARTEDLTVEIQQSTGVAGVMEGNVLGWNVPIKRCNFSQLLTDASYDDRVIIYNRTSHNWMLARYWGPAWGWWGAEFECFEPGRGYWFTIVGSSYNWTQEGI
ncbi:hypothetical protein ACFLZ7_04295 [Nanoarchaeota archaeon]